MALPPGIGNPQQALQATAFMRQQPWYQQRLRSWGLDPKGDANGNVRLSEAQQEQLLNEARQRGIGISDRYQIDENGQIAETPSHLLRNIAIGAGIGGLALTGFGAAGIGPLAGAFGAGAGAAGTGAGLGAAGTGAAGLSAGAAGVGTGIGAGTAAGLTAAGAGTSAALAGGGAPVTAASKGISSWFTPSLVGQGIGAGLGLIGNIKAANASEEAARLEHQSTEEALADARAQRAWQQQQYANYLDRIAPYAQSGQRANALVSGLLQRSPFSAYATGQTNTVTRTPVSVGSGQTPAAQRTGGTPSGQVVLLKAPNGMTKEVPADQADHYVNMGATRV